MYFFIGCRVKSNQIYFDLCISQSHRISDKSLFDDIESSQVCQANFIELDIYN